MNAQEDEGDASLIALAGRIMQTHRADPVHLMRLLAIDHDEACALITLGQLWAPLGVVRRPRLRLFVRILLLFEWRLECNSAEIRQALAMPLGALDGLAAADLLGGSLGDLDAVRRAIMTTDSPTLRKKGAR